MKLSYDLPSHTGSGDLERLAAVLEDQKSRKVDLITDPRNVTATVLDEDVVTEDGVSVVEKPALNFMMPGGGDPIIAVPTNNGHRQISAYTPMPAPYYELVGREAPDLWRENVSHWLAKPRRRKVRRRGETVIKEEFKPRLWRLWKLGENKDRYAVRAVLSNRYRVIDNEGLVMTALDAARDVLHEQGFAPPILRNWSVTERRLSMFLWTPDVFGDLSRFDEPPATGWEDNGRGGINFSREDVARMDAAVPPDDQGGSDLVFAGFEIRHSETGGGKLLVTPKGLRLACRNGQGLGINVAQVHLEGEKEEAILERDTIAAANRVLFMKVRDAVRACFSVERFGSLIRQIGETRDMEMVEPTRFADVIVARDGLSEDVKKSILAAYRQDVSPGRHTVFDGYQALTAAARDCAESNPGLADELEASASNLIKRPRMVMVKR